MNNQSGKSLIDIYVWTIIFKVIESACLKNWGSNFKKTFDKKTQLFWPIPFTLIFYRLSQIWLTVVHWQNAPKIMLYLSRTKRTEVADVVYVNNLIWTVACERVRRGKARGGAVVGKPETRVDGYLSPREKKLVLQVSKWGLLWDVRGWVGWNIIWRINIVIYTWAVNITRFLCSG